MCKKYDAPPVPSASSGRWGEPSHRVVVLAEGKDLGVVSEAVSQSQLGDRLHGQTQQVGTQRGVLRRWE